MTDRKWTPTPWYLDHEGWICGGEDEPVCMIESGGSSEFVFEESIHCAHLIAAAPELYEALEGMLRLADAANAGDRIISHKARAALSKARGEQ